MAKTENLRKLHNQTNLLREVSLTFVTDVSFMILLRVVSVLYVCCVRRAPPWWTRTTFWWSFSVDSNFSTFSAQLTVGRDTEKPTRSVTGSLTPAIINLLCWLDFLFSPPVCCVGCGPAEQHSDWGDASPHYHGHWWVRGVVEKIIYDSKTL